MILDRALRAGIMAIRSTGYAWVVLACGVVASFALSFTVQERVESVARVRFESDMREAGHSPQLIKRIMQGLKKSSLYKK